MYSSCRSEREGRRHVSRQPYRTSTRHFGPPDPANAGPGTAAWLGHIRARPAGFKRRAAHSAGLAVSCPPPPGAARLDQGSLGHFRKQSACQVLRTHQERAPPARTRKRRLGKADNRDGPGAGNCLGGRTCSTTLFFVYAPSSSVHHTKRNPTTTSLFTSNSSSKTTFLLTF